MIDEYDKEVYLCEKVNDMVRVLHVDEQQNETF